MVLLCNVIPAFVVKLLCPYFVHLIPYPVRILSLAATSVLGMLLVVVSPVYDELRPAENAIATKMLGVALASASSGGGEVTFLGLTHFYGPFSLAGWGSGTGAAGLIGAGAYAVATTGLGLGSRATLFASAFLPFAMIGSFFLLLPVEFLKRESTRRGAGRDWREARDDGRSAAAASERMDDERRHADNHPVADDEEEDGLEEGEEEDDHDGTILHNSATSLLPTDRSTKSSTIQPTTLSSHINQMRSLFIP